VRRIDPDVSAAGGRSIDGRERGARSTEVDLSVDLGRHRAANPITTASGCFASGAEIDRFFDVTDLGAIVVKSITLEPREGLPTPRMAETPSGMLNAIGLQNPGIDAWLAKDLPWLQGAGCATVIASIAGKTVDDFREVARKLRGKGGRRARGQPVVPERRAPRAGVRLLAPDSAEVIRAVARGRRPGAREADLRRDRHRRDRPAVVDAGADGLTLINTLLGMAIDPETGRPELSNTYGGLSGPAIRPSRSATSTRSTRRCPTCRSSAAAASAPSTDVVEFLRAGASAVRSAPRRSSTRSSHRGSSTTAPPGSPSGASAVRRRLTSATVRAVVTLTVTRPRDRRVARPVTCRPRPDRRRARRPDPRRGRGLAGALVGEVGWFKVGLELFAAHGPTRSGRSGARAGVPRPQAPRHPDDRRAGRRAVADARRRAADRPRRAAARRWSRPRCGGSATPARCSRSRC
jgi:dihydroorotate dehydrogenase (NAD+) catalytic subunit